MPRILRRWARRLRFRRYRESACRAADPSTSPYETISLTISETVDTVLFDTRAYGAMGPKERARYLGELFPQPKLPTRKNMATPNTAGRDSMGSDVPQGLLARVDHG
jgi:hypothetical protein